MPDALYTNLHAVFHDLVSQLATCTPTENGLVRVEAPLEPVSPLAWLRAQPHLAQYYWADRNGAFEMAGVGEADVCAPDESRDLAGVFDYMRERLSPDQPSLRYYGGFRFDTAHAKTERWQKFVGYRFVAPRFQVLRRGEKYFAACSAAPQKDLSDPSHLIDHLAQLNFTPALPSPAPHILHRTDNPDRPTWSRLVNLALEAMESGDLEKVVLARESTFTADAPFDAAGLLEQLLAHTASAFAFCFHPGPGRAFIGASPERLFKRANVHVQSEALAGTRPRGQDDAGDAALAHALLHSGKDLREHAFVVGMVRQNLERLCDAVNVEETPALMRLRHLQHLYTRIEGVLHDNECDHALIAALHPTPAVGGVPREAALAWLREHEPFDRGIYAAPVGWVGFDAAEFCVAIRSGLIQGNTLALYTGAGIVPGSDPSEEWAEIETKLADFLEVLTG